jgi:hypothetical protein
VMDGLLITVTADMVGRERSIDLPPSVEGCTIDRPIRLRHTTATSKKNGTDTGLK